MPSRLAVLAIDAVQPRVVADFWCAVLGWQVVEEDAGGVSIAPSEGAWPTIDVLLVPERKGAKNRLHLDLRADGVTTSQELDRLLALGAYRVDSQGPDVSWVVLGDPEGNEFCLLSRLGAGAIRQACGPPTGSSGRTDHDPAAVRALQYCPVSGLCSRAPDIQIATTRPASGAAGRVRP